MIKDQVHLRHKHDADSDASGEVGLEVILPSVTPHPRQAGEGRLRPFPRPHPPRPLHRRRQQGRGGGGRPARSRVHRVAQRYHSHRPSESGNGGGRELAGARRRERRPLHSIRGFLDIEEDVEAGQGVAIRFSAVSTAGSGNDDRTALLKQWLFSLRLTVRWCNWTGYWGACIALLNGGDVLGRHVGTRAFQCLY